MKDWYCYINNQTYGPYPENLLRELVGRGQLTADTYVYNDSPKEAPRGWQRAGDTEIAALLGIARVAQKTSEENALNHLRILFSEEEKEEEEIFSSDDAYGTDQFEEETKLEKRSDKWIWIGVALCIGCIFLLLLPKFLLFFGIIVGIVLFYNKKKRSNANFQQTNQGYQKKRSFKKTAWLVVSIFMLLFGLALLAGNDQHSPAQTKAVNTPTPTPKAGGTSAQSDGSSVQTLFDESLNILKKLDETISDTKSEKPSGSTRVQSVDSAYQAVLDEYSKKIRAATPRLINEYKAEAAKNSDGLMGLAQISMAKVFELAEISNEGVSKMAEIMMSNGLGKYEVYEAWSEKLMDVYTEEGEKITDVYMSSASL
jgi:hypothetical protein